MLGLTPSSHRRLPLGTQTSWKSRFLWPGWSRSSREAQGMIDVAEARRNALYAGSINLAVGVLAMIAFHASHQLPLWPVAQFTFSGAVVFVLMWIWKSAPMMASLIG